MNPGNAPQAAIEVRYKSSTSVLLIVAGSIFLAFGVLALVLGTFSLWLILGAILLAGGIVSRSKPFLVFDAGQSTMYMYGLLGNRVRTYGAAKGEQLVFDGTNIMRLTAAGKQKKIRIGSGAPEDVKRLQQTLWSMQQPG
ncbi:hypothetical protein L0U85_13900 [Glycomyces sp. L485]|uniref:hypothetical protein n=1 Tax=Glycomyces sp. L485 TaxID=2909235 RepID=UPI001F4B4E4D|nr:hypothetical protein [Glycomyces sp. L485]MCH7231938.1 hypothetical protein [Glycomyces sp. L485]